LLPGAIQLTVATAFPAAALTDVGAPGAVGAGPLGVTALDAADSALFPTPLVACTVNVYAVPFVRPLIVVLIIDVVAVTLPGVDVTVYPVIADPPLLPGAVQVTVAWPLPAVALTDVGAPGAVADDPPAQLVSGVLSVNR